MQCGEAESSALTRSDDHLSDDHLSRVLPCRDERPARSRQASVFQAPRRRGAGATQAKPQPEEQMKNNQADPAKKEDFITHNGSRFATGFEHSILQNSPAGIIALDRDLRIIYENPEMKKILGVPSGQEPWAIGAKITELPSVVNAGLASLFEDLLEGKTIFVDSHFKSIYGKESFLAIKGVPVFHEGRFNGAVLLITDISERKQIVSELKRACGQAEEASRLKDEFVSLVSHDLRTPFSSILGLLRLLESDPVHPLHEDQKALLQHVLNIGEGLVNMIDKLLDMSKLRTGKIKPRPKFVDAYELCLRVIGALSHVAMNKGVEIVNSVPSGFRIHTDADLYGEVLSNLVSNAIKFSHAGGRIEVFVPEGKSCVAVRDEGVGISAEDVPMLFRHEERISSPGTEGELGSGLGLSFSMNIIKALGGEIEVESRPGEGSVFTARIPEGRPVVLLVENEPPDRELMKDYMKALNVDVIEAQNGREALSIMENVCPNLIITDINMPVMDGFEFLDALRGNGERERTPVMIITSDNKMETREKVFQMGADDFVGKPLARHDFLPRVRRLLN